MQSPGRRPISAPADDKSDRHARDRNTFHLLAVSQIIEVQPATGITVGIIEL